MTKTSSGTSQIQNKRSFQITRHAIGFFVFTVLAFGPALLTLGDSPKIPIAEETRFEETPTHDVANAPKKVADQISALITQLDVQEFDQREAAQNELAKIGDAAIGPLALQSFDCSPESCWRIKKVLEIICTEGDEAVFYKATGILQLRYDGGNVAMSQRLAQLEKEWRGKRKKEAIAKLRNKGATIEDPLEGAADVFGNMPVVMENNLIFVNGDLHSFEPGQPKSDLTTKNKSRSDREQLSEKELKIKIRTILESDIDDNRRLVFGTASNGESALIQDPRFAIQRKIRLNRLMINGQVVNQLNRGTGVVVRFGDKWKGEAKDLELLKDVSHIQEISLTNQPVTSSTLSIFASIPSLNKLTFNGCQLKTNDLKKAEWSPGMTQVEFANQTVSTSIIESFAGIPSLQLATFNGCEMKGAALDALKDLDALRGIQFKETEIDESIFETLANLKQLTYVNLSVCKFQTRDYRALKAKRPKLQIAYTAQAFLGVRGPIDLGAFDAPAMEAAEGCPVSEVIYGSGAQKAGMKVGDVIEKVNGQPIERFEDLRLHIAQHKVGDTLDVVVRRSGKPVKLAVKLGVQNSALR